MQDNEAFGKRVYRMFPRWLHLIKTVAFGLFHFFPVDLAEGFRDPVRRTD